MGTEVSGGSPGFGEITELLMQAWLMFIYDVLIWVFDAVIHTFFRELRLRGTFHIPKRGPIVFVIAPHHNQYVDPVVVMTTVRKTAGRRISLLTAAKTYRDKFIGPLARLCSTIPVERAQDLVVTKPGRIWIENFGPDNDNLVVLGEGTDFERDAMAKGLIGLPEYLGNAQVHHVVSPTKLVLSRPFKVSFSDKGAKNQKTIAYLRDGTSYKAAPHVDNTQMFQSVYRHLQSGQVLGIFPEGGSHDRPGLLPLKPGVAIMALGAVALASDPDFSVCVIPVGLNYFHPHKFRLRVVVEFGTPITVTKLDAQKYEKDNRQAVGNLLDLISLRLQEVTVSCDDFDTLMTVQAARRLYTTGTREEIPLSLVVEMNRRIMKGYEQFADREDVQKLRSGVFEYNKKLMQLGLHDHQVELLLQTNRLGVLRVFFGRLFKVLLFSALSLPGVLMFLPVFIVAKRISRKKAKAALAASTVKIKAKDVIGTWKILVAMGLAPALYIFWALVGTWILVRHQLTGPLPTWFVFVVFYLWSVLTTYASLRVGEIAVDYYKSLLPLVYSAILHHGDALQIENLRERRRELAAEVADFFNKYGPSVFDDFGSHASQYGEIRRGHKSSASLTDPNIFGDSDGEGDDDTDNNDELLGHEAEKESGSNEASDIKHGTAADSDPEPQLRMRRQAKNRDD